MKIKRRICSDGSLIPRAANILRGIPGQYLHHASHGLKHPLTTYQRSLEQIAEAWLDVFPLLERLEIEYAFEGTMNNAPSLLKAYKALLYELNEHIDACYEVVRALCPLDTLNKERFHEKYALKAKAPAFKSFVEKVTKVYRDEHIGIIVNAIKHNNDELRNVGFQDETGIRVGYYLEQVLPSGALGPSPTLHRDMNSGFSFNRDMLLHLWWIYRIGEELAKCVEAVMTVWHNKTIVPVSNLIEMQSWANLSARCSLIRPQFFPDEMLKAYPLVICPPDKSSIMLQYPSPVRPLPISKNPRVSTYLRIEEGALSVALPYMNPMIGME